MQSETDVFRGDRASKYYGLCNTLSKRSSTACTTTTFSATSGSGEDIANPVTVVVIRRQRKHKDEFTYYIDRWSTGD